LCEWNCLERGDTIFTPDLGEFKVLDSYWETIDAGHTPKTIVMQGIKGERKDSAYIHYEVIR